MQTTLILTILIAAAAVHPVGAEPANSESRAGNPIFPGWYADPEGAIFGNEYWVFPTYSAPYDEQTHFDAFSSTDLVHWDKHERILDTQAVPWVRRALWAPAIVEKQGKYYFMWSEGGWTGPDYSVAYGIADSPLGPFKRVAKILQQDPQVGTGAGHHSVIHDAAADLWYIVYHRRPLTETDGNHRVTCIDRMEFDAQGLIKPVKITKQGVALRTLRKP
ncbi:MAG: family 43 glycosylhydrolase [Verrucomicrobiota bacterium]